MVVLVTSLLNDMFEKYKIQNKQIAIIDIKPICRSATLDKKFTNALNGYIISKSALYINNNADIINNKLESLHIYHNS